MSNPPPVGPAALLTPMELIRLVSHFFVAGVIATDGRVVQAAPIVKYSVGWTTHQLYAYAMKRGWSMELV